MQMIWSPASTSIEYLDVKITLSNDRVSFSTYSKSVEQHLYIPPFSNHPSHTMTGWIYGELLRLHRTNSSEEQFIEHSTLFIKQLKKRGYGNNIIKQAIKKWSIYHESDKDFPGVAPTVNILDVLDDTGMPQRMSPPAVFSLPTDPLLVPKDQTPRIYNIINDAWNTTPAMNVLSKPMITFKTGRNLGSILFQGCK